MVLREVEIGKFTIMSTSTKTLFWTFLLQMILFLSDQNFNLVRPLLQFFHNNTSNMRNFFEILILSQNFGSFASYKKGMDTFQCEMSM